MKLKPLLQESITNNSFKALFLIAPPGSGKTTVIKQSNIPKETVIITQDISEERALAKNEPLETRHVRTEVEDRLTNAILETRPIIIETTPASDKLLQRVRYLQRLGYEVKTVIVKFDDIDELISRVEDRAKKIGRYVDTEYIIKSVKEVDTVIPYLQNEVETEVVNNPESATKSISMFFSKGETTNKIGQQKIKEMKKRGLNSQYPGLMTDKEYQWLSYTWH